MRAKVGHRLGTSQYLIIFDIKSGEYEAMPITGDSGPRGAGIQTVMLAAGKGIKTIITGYCSPAIRGPLKANGMEILTDFSGTVEEVIEKYKKCRLHWDLQTDTEASPRGLRVDKSILANAARSSARQFINLFPALLGVVLLIGLFNAFVSKSLLTSIFSGNIFLDSIWGACLGSILAGNPINSYVIGDELLKYGISLSAVTAFIITWVTVGLIQLPAEIAALGKKFALLRNGLSFVLSIPIAIVTVLIVNVIAR